MHPSKVCPGNSLYNCTELLNYPDSVQNLKLIHLHVAHGLKIVLKHPPDSFLFRTGTAISEVIRRNQCLRVMWA